MVLEHVLVNVQRVKFGQKVFDQHVEDYVIGQGKSPNVRRVVIVVIDFLGLYIEHVYLGFLEVYLVIIGDELSFPVVKVSDVAGIALSEAEIFVAESVLVFQGLVVQGAVST